MNLGKQLQYFRKQKNITQEALAGAMGVSTKAVSKWEKDLLLPDISTLCKLSDFLAYPWTDWQDARLKANLWSAMLTLWLVSLLKQY